jgi:hypothetical protein
VSRIRRGAHRRHAGLVAVQEHNKRVKSGVTGIPALEGVFNQRTGRSRPEGLVVSVKNGNTSTCKRSHVQYILFYEESRSFEYKLTGIISSRRTTGPDISPPAALAPEITLPV